jgi:putative solute:sodium symporter small subunit
MGRDMTRSRQIALPFLVWAVFGVLLHVSAPTLNGLKLIGLPAGYWLAAQGAPLILAGLAIWLTAGKGSKREDP